MPDYLGEQVSDKYMQRLIKGFRDGQRAAGGESAVEDADAPIIKLLEENEVTIAGYAPTAYELGKSGAK
jgi:hypothetical protein